MSDERQAFEQLHAIPSGAEWCEKRHIYIHKNYSGLVLHPINESWEAFCKGALWQASRQVDGESVAYITERKLEWLKSGPVLSAVVYRKHSEGSIPLYTHPASRQAVSVPKQWVDLMRELVKDLISEIKTKQKIKPDERVAEDLGAVREAIAMIAKQEQGHE